ncbi:kinase-like protein, partial [Thozetella sp. PMI_491]
GNKFLPVGKIQEILQHDAIIEHLQFFSPELHRRCLVESHPFSESPDILKSITEYICGMATKNDTGLTEQARKIFAILLYNEQTLEISDFIKYGIHDGHLPLLKTREGEIFELDIDGDIDKKPDLRFLEGWNQRDKNNFEETQWFMLSPVFEPPKGLEFPDINIDSRVALPCIAWDEVLETWHSIISKDGNYFALKKLKSLDKVDFELEAAAFRKTPRHDHLTPLYASFEHRNRYHLLFPWAAGRNLEHLWSEELPEPEANAKLWLWFSQQCLGLADALQAIHNIDRSESYSLEAANGVISRRDDRNCGRHGDVKPENVLWFKNEDNEYGYGVLKITDFGLTRFRPAGDTKVSAGQINVTESYKAPEYEVDLQVSRPFDIWSLGCLYLEFMTWLLQGKSGVARFEELRSQETSKQKFASDKFFDVLAVGLHFQEEKGERTLGASNNNTATSNSVRSQLKSTLAKYWRLRFRRQPQAAVKKAVLKVRLASKEAY